MLDKIKAEVTFPDVTTPARELFALIGRQADDFDVFEGQDLSYDLVWNKGDLEVRITVDIQTFGANPTVFLVAKRGTKFLEEESFSIETAATRAKGFLDA
jgi:hypothetical protein